MTPQTRTKLKEVLHHAFKDSYELGGGKEYRYFHGVWVATFAMKIVRGEHLTIDEDALYIASLFHDIGKVSAIDEKGEIQYESEANMNHDNIGIDLLEGYIGNLVKKDLIEKAIDVIHESKSKDSSLESKVLRDADELGNFGYMQVWKTSTYAALSGVNFSDAIGHWNKRRLGDRKSLAESLSFEISKRIALERFDKFTNFLIEIQKETEGEDIE